MYWELKEAAPDCTPWKTRFGKGYGRVARQGKKRKKKTLLENAASAL
jgi:hypothetical protein